MSDHATIRGLHTEVEKLLEQLEQVCFDLKASPEATQSARIRRQQLIDVRDYLLGHRRAL